jgi:hypothetical protein
VWICAKGGETDFLKALQCGGAESGAKKIRITILVRNTPTKISIRALDPIPI